MFARLFLLFVLVPLIELAVLIRIGNLLGLWPTIGLVVLTGALGAALAKSQGVRVLRSIQMDLNDGRMPASHLLDGLLVLIGGLTLLTPGFLTDIVGFLLLIPVTRNRLKEVVRRRLDRILRSGQTTVITFIR
jgi:UPF0716 protein FxsA